MFEKIKNLDKGRIKIKLMAIMLIISLTFSNFAILGSFMEKAISSYAEDMNLDTQTNETNSENVKFDAYLMTGADNEKIREQTADINSQNAILHLEVSVQGAGYLDNAKIEFGNTNFDNKEITKTNIEKLSIGTIETGKNVVLEIPLIANKDVNYNLGLLSMLSEIKLLGEYIATNGKVTSINTSKYVKVNWTTDSIKTEDVQLSKSVITNKIVNVNIDGTNANKRIVQVLVNSKIKDNKVPVKTSIIEITNPITGLAPDKVEVSAYTTKATNGKVNVDFNEDLWEYKSDEGKTYITISNNANDKNIIAWEKDCTDTYVVTYVYDEDATADTVGCNIKATMELYGRETVGATVENTNTLPLEALEETSNIAILSTNMSEKIYKGELYTSGETTFKVSNSLYIPYSDIVKTITIIDSGIAGGSKVLDKEGNLINETNGVEIYYKSIKVNRAQAIKLLGSTGKLEIYDLYQDGNPKIGEIVLSERTEEYVEFSFESLDLDRKIQHLIIIPSELKSEGKIDVIAEKTIKVSNKEKIFDMATLEVTQNMSALSVETEIGQNGEDNKILATNANKKTAKLLEPVTTFDVSLNKESISTQVENELKITAELKSNSSNHKLFDKPTIKIELPKELGETTVENIEAALHGGKLTLKTQLDSNKNLIVTKEDGTRELVIELDGTQTEYNTAVQNVTIGVDLKIKANPFISDRNVEIKATCINCADNVESKENIKLVSKKGLITKNILTIGQNTIQEVNNNNLKVDITENANAIISTEIMNNFGENISNINIVGKIPVGVTLTNGIASRVQGIKVAYSEETNPAINSDTWKEKITNEELAKVRSFKISLEEFANGSIVDLSYGISVNIENIENSIELINELGIDYVINEQTKREVIEYILNIIKGDEQPETPTTPETPETPNAPEQEKTAMIEIKPKTTIDTVYVGQIVTFEIKVKNTTAEKLSNVILDYTIPQGAVVTELTYAQATDVVYTDHPEIKNKIYEIRELNPNATITKEVTLKIINGVDSVINKANLKDAQNNVIFEFESNPITIKQGKISAILSRRDNKDIDITSESVIEYIIMVKNNTTTTMNNLKIKSQVPNKTIWIEDTEYNASWRYDSDSKNIEQTINSLAAGETKEVRFRVKVEKIDNDYSMAKIENIASVTLESGEVFETNMHTSNVSAPIWDIHMTAEHSNELKEGDAVKYIIKVTNSGERTTSVFVEDLLPQEIQPRKITYYINENNKVEDLIRNQKVEVLYPVAKGETLTIILEGVTYELEENVSSKQISNVAKIVLGDGEYLESETIINTIINDIEGTPGDDEDPKDPQKPDDKPGDDEDPKDPQEPDDKPEENAKYSISGLAWLDSNKDGIRQPEEKTLQLIKVMLLDNKGNKVLETTTSLAGTYKFSNLGKGEYMVAFEYDTEKYAVAKYKVSSTNEETNSDVISKTITLNNENKTVGITDTIKLTDKDIANIDIGLIENPVLDLSLNKYISKVVVTNKQGTSTYEYNDTELAKVEIGAKYIDGTSLLVEYEIEIVNEGDVNGYVTDIIDYLPEELEFNSEMNSEWYLGKDNNLHYMALNPEPIEPGKTQTVKLVLTRTLKADSTGTIENIAEIAESTSLEALKDIDSIAGNKQSGEDDIDSASLIVSIRTGSPIMYIGIVIASMLVLGIGIYIIDKKVLKVKI